VQLSVHLAGELTLAQRELARATAALALEEHRNRGLPPQAPWRARRTQRRFSDGVTDTCLPRPADVLTIQRTWTLRCERGSAVHGDPALEFFTEVITATRC